jgi:hypothetical protein
MPGLLRGVARVAVVAGTATAVSNRVSRRQAGRWSQQQAQQQDQREPEPQDDAGPPADRAPASTQGNDMDSKLAQLKQLGQLKEQGVLNEAEFETQKSKILSS